MAAFATIPEWVKAVAVGILFVVAFAAWVRFVEGWYARRRGP